MSQIHSTGRGGAGNIGPDDKEYTDGSIVREGPSGQSSTGGEYSTGRGGQGNIDARSGSRTGQRLDEEIVPETATREDRVGDYANFHTGRGGEGNVHKDKYGGHTTKAEQEAAQKRDEETGKSKEGMGEKVKKALHLDK